MTSRPTGIRGILFDLWNTIACSESQPNPMALIAEAFDLSARPDWRKVIERGMMTRRLLGIREGLEALERETGRLLEPPAREALIRAWNVASGATRLFDDALPVLRAARGRHRLGLISNTQSFDVDFLRSRGVEPLLDVVCLSCDVGRLKPDPIFFATAVERLSLPPEAVLMVGDSVEDDVRGALEAGLSALHLDRAGGAPAVPGSAGSIRRLTEIGSLLP